MSSDRHRRSLGGVLAWLVGLIAVVGMAAATIAFLNAGSSEDDRPGRMELDARRCPAAEDDGVFVLVFADEAGTELCHYIDRLSGREVTPPFDVPALPLDAVS